MVDDEPLMHLLYKRHLEAAGYEMFSAKDGAEAVAKVVQIVPDVIIMDIMMPGEDGLSALREIKKLEKARAIPVLITTSNLEYYNTAISECGNSGAAAFLSKPLSPAKLIAEIKRVAPCPVLTS
jgi:CheY-like chemotaxis protein